MNDPKFANKDSSETRFIRLLWFLPPNSPSNFDLLSFGFHCVRFDSSREDKSGHVSFVTRQVVLCRISTHLASRICRRTSCLQLWRYSRLLKSKEKQLYLDSRGGGCIFLLPLTTSTILLPTGKTTASNTKSSIQNSSITNFLPSSPTNILLLSCIS